MTGTTIEDDGDVETLVRPTHDERSRQRFVSTLRKFSISDMPEVVRDDFEDRVRPVLDARGLAPVTWRDIDRSMQKRSSFRLYSSLRYHAQEMCFMSVQDPVERALPDLVDAARAIARDSPAGGSLRLNPELAIPNYVSALDTHLTPGSFHSEYRADDVAQGAVISLGSRVFGANQRQRLMFGGVGKAIARWMATAHPEVAIARVLDVGTSSGKNLLPYFGTFDGVEAHGIDVAAPLLRYGHAIAEKAGLPVHFSQQNAEATNFPDGHFDLIVSSFFFHELPVKVTRRILRECHRLLRPGGMIVHQELPAENLVDAWENYYWNWDTRNNNEPFYTAFRAQNPIDLCAEAGFARGTCFAQIIPDVTAFPDRTEAFAWDEPGRPMHGRGGWYVFGGRKD